ncbi:YlbL family protein [Nocardiopsis baichengensis]|uniref:YlbL family protein n=1 Tax=Nocardiopsis baichengensis TaxID=280240 RepID=UPI0003479980|nr:PDZ domain-containing protein [Nocardiopsis baichengensis]
MLRRAKTLITAVILLVGLAVGSAFLPVPYLVASPGITLNTIGDDADGDPVIEVEGRESYRHEGDLSMVTVQYAGGPGRRMNILTVISAWLSPTQAVLPEAALFPPDHSVEEVSESQTLAMDESQTSAVAAALTEMGVDYDLRPVVAGVTEDAPADGVLEAGDVVLEVDGEQVADKGEAAERVGDRDPGDAVELTVERDGEQETVEVTTEEDDEGGAVVGIMIADDPDFPFDVDFQIEDVGGPSAGMMFALGIMDRLDPDGLTGGHDVAGTGTIDAEGKVGGVSGVAQKMVSARDEGAEYFLVADESCSQTFESAATGDMEVFKVEELGDAVAALEAIKTGEGLSDLPRCGPGA